MIRALLATGAALLREEALERGYRKLAETYPEVHDAKEAQARRRRYADRVDRHDPVVPDQSVRPPIGPGAVAIPAAPPG